MLNTYLRSLSKNKAYSFLNIFGLAIGMACAGLIFLWVEDEMNFDSDQRNIDQIYMVRVNQHYDNYTSTHSSTPGVMGPALKQDIPGIKNTCIITEEPTTLLFTSKERKVYASGYYAEPSFFQIFTYPLIKGDKSSVFAQKYSVVLTESAVRKFFDKETDVIGRSVRINNTQDYIVTGVIKDPAANSSFQFEWLVPYKVFYDQSPWARKWENSCVTTIAELEPQALLATINKALYNYLPSKAPGATSRAFLFGMNQWHLYNQFHDGKQTGGGRIEYVRLFSLIAWIILIIACINFMNLATSRSEKKAREVGVRKVLGAGKMSLIFHFIGEAIFMASLSAIAAVLIMFLALPYFNQLVNKDLVLGLIKPGHMLALAGLTLFCGIIAGSYPSFYLSSFNPVFVLKGIKLKSGSAAIIRKGLVVLQFSMSITLIISTVIIYQQINHVKARNLGFNKANLLEMRITGDMLRNFDGIRQDLVNTGVVEDAGITDHETIYSGNNTTGITWQGKDPNSSVLISNRCVSPGFISLVGMKLLAGRDFTRADAISLDEHFRPKLPEKRVSIMVTRSMEKLLGNESAIGKLLVSPDNEPKNNLTLEVIGVVDDYVYGDMYGRSDPVIFYYVPQVSSLLYLRIKDHVPLESALTKIAAVMKSDNPAYPFDYKFVDDQFNQMFVSEMLISRLSRVFAFLAIVISCLGLFGLAAYATERRTREIGIRKVLGASATGLARMLSAEFMVLVIVSCLVAFPLAWWIMSQWLLGYAYRINISWWVFLLAAFAAILIALGTVSFQAIKAALANPIKSLRSE